MNASVLTFVPLGGAGEIGMNFNVYGTEGRWLAVDCGIGFTHTSPTETEVLLPDPTFLANRADALEGLVLTHVHLDHLGAVVDLWPRLKCPVHCTPFAAHVLRPRLRDAGLEEAVRLIEHVPTSRWRMGPFDLQYVGLTHSTIEMMGLVLRTQAATVFHTGDWKLDPDPGVGPASDLQTLRRLGDEGVDVVVADSTNATKPGRSRSEGEVRRHLRTLLAGRQGRVAVGVFSSNIARIAALCELADEVDRHPVLVGRSLERMVMAAQGAGYLRDLPPFVTLRDAGYLPRDKVLLVCTGTQSEPGSALQKLAADQHPAVSLDEGDTVVFSSKIIPGNEDVIAQLHAALRARNIDVIHEGTDPAVHASGHPYRDELAELYAVLRPTTVVPVHGEARHMAAHADWARQLGLEAVEVVNGDVVHLGPGRVQKDGRVRAGRFPRVALRAPRPWERPRRVVG